MNSQRDTINACWICQTHILSDFVLFEVNFMATESDHSRKGIRNAGRPVTFVIERDSKEQQYYTGTLGKIADKRSHELLYKIISDVFQMMRSFRGARG